MTARRSAAGENPGDHWLLLGGLKIQRKIHVNAEKSRV